MQLTEVIIWEVHVNRSIEKQQLQVLTKQMGFGTLENRLTDIRIY